MTRAHLRCVFAALAALLGGATADASLVIDVIGFSGAGVSTWSFSGSSQTRADDSIRTASVGTFDTGSDGEFGDIIADNTIQDDLFAASSGSAMFFLGTGEFQESRTITHIFLDYDTSNSDVGIRVNSEFLYGTSTPSAWTGSIVVPIEIDDLQSGSFMNTVSSPNFAAGIGQVTINVTAVPEPASMALMGFAALGGIGLNIRRRRGARRPVRADAVSARHDDFGTQCLITFSGNGR